MSSTSLSPPAVLTDNRQQAKALGYPFSLFGYNPTHHYYWYEPGMGWRGAAPGRPPVQPLPGGVCYQMADDTMAPRFPRGSVVMLWHVASRLKLELGKPYVYSWADTDSGEVFHEAGRLTYIGKHFLGAVADNNLSLGLLWPIDKKVGFEGVRLIDAYVSYPNDLVVGPTYRS